MNDVVVNEWQRFVDEFNQTDSDSNTNNSSFTKKHQRTLTSLLKDSVSAIIESEKQLNSCKQSYKDSKNDQTRLKNERMLLIPKSVQHIATLEERNRLTQIIQELKTSKARAKRLNVRCRNQEKIAFLITQQMDLLLSYFDSSNPNPNSTPNNNKKNNNNNNNTNPRNKMHNTQYRLPIVAASYVYYYSVINRLFSFFY